MQGLRFRPATLGDVEAIAANNIATALETEGLRLPPRRARRGVLQMIQDPAKGFYLLAELEAQVVGQLMVTLEWSDWRDGAFWWVQSVYVVPEHRRMGVLTALFRELESRARSAEGVVGLRLYVERGNLQAQEAYSRLGLDGSRYLVFEKDFTR
jgi:GNAT superfamily N-acetyltransferase